MTAVIVDVINAYAYYKVKTSRVFLLFKRFYQLTIISKTQKKFYSITYCI